MKKGRSKSDFLIELSDFFIPRFCEACDKKLATNEKVLCPDCLAGLTPTDKNLLQTEYERKFGNDNSIDEFYSAFIFKVDEPIQKLLHKLKYKNKFRIGNFFGEKLAERFENEIKNFSPDFIIPVPLHRLKKAMRGYNQSYYIAKGIAKQTGIKVNGKILVRKKFTETQTHLNAEERKLNIENAFNVRKASKIKGKRVILIDDVITTGATTSEAAKVLKENGAEKIMALSVAIPELD